VEVVRQALNPATNSGPIRLGETCRMTNVKSRSGSWLRKTAVWRWLTAWRRHPRSLSTPLAEPEPAPAADDSRWHLYVPYAAPELQFTDPLVETVSGYEISIARTGPRYGVIAVKDLPSAEVAQDVFNALTRGVVAASLNLSTGIRIKDELTVLHQDDNPLPNDEDQPFACRQGRSLARIFIIAGEASCQIPKILDTLRQSLKVGFGHLGVEKSLRNPRTMLACRLFIDSHFEASDEARLLSLMGVLEVLKEQDAASAHAQRLVEKWIEESAQLEPAEAQSFDGSLNHMKSISIGRGIRGVVERHLGPDRARKAQKLYNVRSSLVHDGKRPDNLGDAVLQTESIARDLLISILTSHHSDGQEL
jgi:hypothetical protein